LPQTIRNWGAVVACREVGGVGPEPYADSFPDGSRLLLVSSGPSDGHLAGMAMPDALNSVVNDFFHDNTGSRGFAFSTLNSPPTPQTADLAGGHPNPALFDFAAFNHAQQEAANAFANFVFAAAQAGTSQAGAHDDHAIVNALLHDFHILS
jgi:hypothetical protein